LDTTTAIITIIIVLFAFVVSVVATQIIRARRDSIVLRRIPAYDRMPMLVSESIETDRPVHFSFGSAVLGGATTPLLLANAEGFSLLAQRAAVGIRTPLMTTSEVATLPVAYDILRRAYRNRRRIDQFNVGAVQWYPEGPRSLAFAAAVSTVASDYRVNTHILTGSFGTELALMMDAAVRRRQTVIAASDQLDGQAIAYAMSDETLLGEELFASGAYLGGGAAQTGGIVALDVMRVFLILALVLLTVDQLLGGTLLARLLTGGG
jgi:hypothetical protein